MENKLTNKETTLFINQIIIKVKALGMGMNENISNGKADIISHLKYLQTHYQDTDNKIQSRQDFMEANGLGEEDMINDI